MAVLTVTQEEERQLAHLARHGRDGRVVRRAQGLVWLARGVHPVEVARRLGVTRESVYAWARRWPPQHVWRLRKEGP